MKINYEDSSTQIFLCFSKSVKNRNLFWFSRHQIFSGLRSLFSLNEYANQNEVVILQ